VCTVFLPGTTQLQYIEDYELVNGLGHAIEGMQKAKRKTSVGVHTKVNNLSNKKTTEKRLFMAGAPGATPYTDCRWSTRVQLGLSMNHTLEILKEETSTTVSGRMF